MLDEELLERPYLDAIDEPVYSIAEPAVIVGILDRMGVRRDAALAGSGISPEMLDDPLGRVSARQRTQIYFNARKLATDPALGLTVGRSLHLSSYGIYGFGLISSATLESAIHFAFKYLKLGGPLMEKRARIEAGDVVFEALDTLALDDLFPLALEIWFSSVFAMAKDALADDFFVSAVELSYPEPAHGRQYRALFGDNVVFDAPANKFCFDASYLKRQLAQSSELSRRLCQTVCDRLLAEFESHANLADKLRRAMVRTSGRIMDLDEAARKLQIAPRTLRRRLDAEGTSFRAIRRDVRKALSIEYLCNTRLTIAEIAERVGFSDAANFRAAFKRWTGFTPTAYRAKFASASPESGFAALWNPAGLHLSG